MKKKYETFLDPNGAAKMRAAFYLAAFAYLIYSIGKSVLRCIYPTLLVLGLFAYFWLFLPWLYRVL